MFSVREPLFTIPPEKDYLTSERQTNEPFCLRFSPFCRPIIFYYYLRHVTIIITVFRQIYLP